MIAVYSENKLQHYATAYRNHKNADEKLGLFRFYKFLCIFFSKYITDQFCTQVRISEGNHWPPPSFLGGPFGIFEGHELMEKNTTKMDLQLNSCFEYCKAHSFTLKIKTFSFCVKEQLKMSISLSDKTSSIVWEEIVSTYITKMFWK